MTKRDMMIGFEDVPISVGITTGHCIYLEGPDDGIYICVIQRAIENGDQEFLETVPAAHLKWATDNCLDYPMDLDGRTDDPKIVLPEGCGYIVRTEVV